MAFPSTGKPKEIWTRKGLHMNFEDYVKEKLISIETCVKKIACLDTEVAVLKVKLSGTNKQLKVIWGMVLLIVGGFIALAFK